MKQHWIQTHGGGVFEFGADARVSDVHAMVATVAHALNQLCRFTGHTPYHYSVAEHSCIAARLWGTTNEEKLAILVHDAHEAFFGDVSAPLKRYLAETGSDVRLVEAACSRRTLTALGLYPGLLMRHEVVVHEADMGMLRAEQEVLFPEPAKDWGLGPHTAESKAAAALLRKRQGYLRTAHHNLQLAFEAEEEDVISAHAPPLPLPRHEVRFGWPSAAEFVTLFERFA